jgi:hypothetical protein
MDHFKQFGKLPGQTLSIMCLTIWALLPDPVNAGVASTNSLPDDPFCSLPNSVAQPASTLRMIARLEQFRLNPSPAMISFMNEPKVDWLQKSLPLATNWQKRVQVQLELGVQLLQAGRTEAALTEFQAVENSLARVGGSFDEVGKNTLRLSKALGILRLGEQENCLLNHNAESCLFPLQPAAFHQLPRGSRGAIALYTEHLKEYPQDLSVRWLINLAYMTLGEYPDKVPNQWLVPPTAFASEYALPRFPDIAGYLGLDVDDLAGGCILDDFDNDGFIDVVASAWSLKGQLRYFQNRGDGHFTERTIEARLSGMVGGLNIQQTDYNNDGWLDIWILRGAWMGKGGRIPNSLLRNNGNGTFTDVTEESRLLSFHPTQTSAWFDYDGDGWLDLFIGNESVDASDPDPCELYHNNRDGTFTECAAASGLTVSRFVKAVACADYDHDGRPDLYLSCRDGGRNLLFHNDGPAGTASDPWRFREVSRQAGVSDSVFSFSTWFFDYDNDGWEDLFVSGYSVRELGEVTADYLGLPHNAAMPRLFRNNHDGTFTNVTASAHLNRVCLTMGCNFGDLDNDGWLDFYLGTGTPDLDMLVPNRMFRNAEGKFFQEVTTTTGTGHLQKGHAVGFADLDNDGDQDIYTVIGGAKLGDNYRNALFQNPGNTNHWLKLKLEGIRSNRAAIGARINVTVSTPTGPRHLFKTVNSGGSFGSNPFRQEFGLGNATAITAVEILWPATGAQQRFTGLALDRAYRLRENDTNALVLDSKRFEFDLQAKHIHQHSPPVVR